MITAENKEQFIEALNVDDKSLFAWHLLGITWCIATLKGNEKNIIEEADKAYYEKIKLALDELQLDDKHLSKALFSADFEVQENNYRNTFIHIMRCKQGIDTSKDEYLHNVNITLAEYVRQNGFYHVLKRGDIGDPLHFLRRGASILPVYIQV